VIAQTEEQANYVWNVVQAYKDANGAIANNASDISHALEVEKTGQQIVLGYRNQALLKQASANDLEKTYQENLAKTAKSFKDIEDSLKTSGTYFASLSKSFAKFGNEDMAKVLSGLSEMANDAANFAAALGKGDYIAAAVSGVALIADAWTSFFGGQTEAEKKIEDARKKAEQERIDAVHKLEDEYQAKFDSDVVRLEKERDKAIEEAKRIGASVLQIEAYYAGQIEKVKRTTADISIESSRVESEKKKISDRYKVLTDAINAENLKIANATSATAFKIDMGNVLTTFNGTLEETIAWVRKWGGEGSGQLKDLLSKQSSLVASLGSGAISALNTQMQSELGQVVYNLQLFEERAQGAMNGVATSLTDALKKGTSEADFSKSIMDMLRNMAIEAAIIAGGFQEKFKDIGVSIAEALKDGFQEGELDSISASIDQLYTDALVPITKINELFAGRGIISSGAQDAIAKAAKDQADALDASTKAAEKAAKDQADIAAQKAADILAAEKLIQDGYKKTGDSLLSTMTNALSKGLSEVDFTKSIMDSLRNMAIDAAVLAGGFADKFKAVGQTIAEALKDGFQSEEIASIKGTIASLYGEANTSVTEINKLFPGFASGTPSAPGGLSWVGEQGPELMNIPRGAQIIPHSQSAALSQSFASSITRGDTNITIQSNAPLDPIQTAFMVKNTQESLAFAGVA